MFDSIMFYLVFSFLSSFIVIQQSAFHPLTSHAIIIYPEGITYL